MGTNDITGDKLISKLNTPVFEANYDKVFKKPLRDCEVAYENEEKHEAKCTHWILGWEGDGKKL